MRAIKLATLLFATTLLTTGVQAAENGAAPDTPFIQESHQAHPLATKEANDVRAVAVDSKDNVWAATKAGAYVLQKGATEWTAVMAEADSGPAFNLAAGADGTVWVGAWNGLYRGTAAGLNEVKGIDHPVSAVCATKDGVTALGPDGMWTVGANDTVTTSPLPCAKRIRNAMADPDGSLWFSTGMGLFHHAPSGNTLYKSSEELLTSDVYSAAFTADGNLWIGGLGGVTVYRGGKRAGQFTPAEGLPNPYAQCVARGPGDVMWVGLTNGVARYDGKSWSLRAAPRWLVNNDVRGIAFDSAGTAWIATAGGVSAISRTNMTLAQKAQKYLDACLARHVREPGLVEKCLLKKPGDLTSWTPRDDDNDGQYTAMYLGMQSYRYAATKDPQARANAKSAFAALHFLQTVTDTPGFVSRSVIPTAWTAMNDRNEKFSDKERADRRVKDPRDKSVENHWRPSKDGKWWWKGDTSSDEITGHFYGYLMYYDLAADEAERKVVQEHVRRVMDYIIAGGYVLKDIDGTHTRWAVWAPELLNQDPDWQAERGINSVEILSYLKATYHITGDEKYQQEYLKLLHEHGYAENARRAKIYNLASRTHIDDELLALAFPALLMYEKDPELAKLYRESLDWWYKGIEKDESPYFNFLYAGLTGQKDPHFDQSLANLRDCPLDLIRWTMDNSQREDIRLVRAPEIEPLQTERMLPPSERGVIRWDENPWCAVRGENGQQESDGVYWMLPYWMGRYYGFIQ